MSHKITNLKSTNNCTNNPNNVPQKDENEIILNEFNAYGPINLINKTIKIIILKKIIVFRLSTLTSTGSFA